MERRMRAQGKDIVELFGFSPDDQSPPAQQAFHTAFCPFVGNQCGKRNHDGTITYGVCTVSNGANSPPESDVIACPKRLYTDNYRILQNAADLAWGADATSVIAGGSKMELKERALSSVNPPAVAFGQGSGSEISVHAGGKLSMDWVVQRYHHSLNGLTPLDYIGIEVQSMDITGNYKAPWEAYAYIKNNTPVDFIPNSGHGLNWANVIKRLNHQIIKKGNIYSKSKLCSGFFFILPDVVFKRFEEFLGPIETQKTPSNKNVSVITYHLSQHMQRGKIRDLEQTRVIHYSLEDIKKAIVKDSYDSVAQDLEVSLANIL